MREAKHPYPFPDVPAWPPRFPASVDLATPISELASWWLFIECDCPRFYGSYYPFRLMSAEIGWGTRVGNVLDRLKCKRCGKRPVTVKLVENTNSGPLGLNPPQQLLLRRYR